MSIDPQRFFIGVIDFFSTTRAAALLGCAVGDEVGACLSTFGYLPAKSGKCSSWQFNKLLRCARYLRRFCPATVIDQAGK